MERVRAGRVAALVLVSMVVGSLAIPRFASAVGTIVTIQGGGSTNKAAVTGAGQVLGAESATTGFHEYTTSFTAQGCRTLVRVPAQRGLILKQAVMTVTFSQGAGNVLVLYVGGGCSFTCEFLRLAGLPGTTTTIPLEPGFALAPGEKISGQVGNIDMDLHLFGYLVPKAAVPATTAVTITP
jgi:hypothetical protein